MWLRTPFQKMSEKNISDKELVAPPPEHCPGPQSESAGKQSGCAGCPNQSICSSGAARGPDPGVFYIYVK